MMLVMNRRTSAGSRKLTILQAEETKMVIKIIANAANFYLLTIQT